MTTPLYFNYQDLRFNTDLQALEYNSGNEVWVQVPVPSGDIALSNGKLLVGNASDLATAVTLSGAATLSNAGVMTLTLAQYSTIAGNVSGAGIANTVLTVDTVGGHVGINNAPNASYALKVSSGSVYFAGSGADLTVGRDIRAGQDNTGRFIGYRFTTVDTASPMLLNQGILQSVSLPSVTTTQKGALAAQAAGCIVFDSSLGKLCVYNGVSWETVTSV
jgi:hypothetical protein